MTKTRTSVDVGEEEDLFDRELDEYVELDIDDEEWGAGAFYKWKSDLRSEGRATGCRRPADGAEIEFDIDDGAIGDPIRRARSNVSQGTPDRSAMRG